MLNFRLKALTASIMFALTITEHAQAQTPKISNDVVKIGVLTDMGGPFSDIGGPSKQT
jgi:hypothetical protein